MRNPLQLAIIAVVAYGLLSATCVLAQPSGNVSRNESSTSEQPVVYVVGNVVSPQSVIIGPGLTLTQALARAGGLRRDSHRSEIRIYRRVAEDSTRGDLIVVDLKAIMKRREEDIALHPDDIVDVAAERGRHIIWHPSDF